MKGKIQEISEVKLLKEGQNKKGRAWTLYGTNLKVGGAMFGMTSFSKKELEEKLRNLSVGQTVEFETEESGDFTNVKKDAEIKVLAQASESDKATPVYSSKPSEKKPTVPFMSDEDVFALMDKCIEAVDKSMTKHEMKVESIAEITTMINSAFIACREERKTQRRWE